LSPLKPDAYGTSRAGRLSLATTARGLAVAAGFTLPKSLAAVLGTRTGFQIMESHND
jgi:hypothetical protein